MPEKTTMSVGRPLIVVVDDQVQILAMLSRILEKTSADVLQVEGGLRACEILRDVVPSLILLDQCMPDLPGIEVCRWIRAQPHLAEVPVIFFSGQAEEQDVAACIEAGASDFVVKPFNAIELRLRVDLHLKLAENTRIANTVSSAVRDAIVYMDSDGNIAGWNRAAEEIFGYSVSEVMGRELHALIAPARFRELHYKAFDAFRESGTGAAVGRSLELLALHKNGHEFPIELSLSSMRIAGGWWAVGIARDITERKRADQERQRAHDALRLVLEHMPIGVVLIDLDHRVRWANSEVARMAGFENSSSLLGSQCNSLLCPAQKGACPVLDLGKRIENTERVLTRADGREIPILKTVNRVDVDGEPMLLETFIDISERKQQEAALRASEENFRGLFEGSRDAIMTMEPPSWLFTSANQATVELFGASSREQLLALGPVDVSPARQPDGQDSALAAKAQIEKAMHTGSAFFEWTHRRLSGEDFPCTVLLTRMTIANRQFLQATVRDVSSSKQLEAELGHARKLEAVGQLAAGIAHEINTPTQFIGDSLLFLTDAFTDLLGLVGALESQASDSSVDAASRDLAKGFAEAAKQADLDYLRAEVPGALASCSEGVRRIATIVRAMKDFAHPDQRAQAPADLNKAIENTLVIARNEYKYVADVETELGELPAVMCHLGDLNQVFLNLLVNAAHAIADAPKLTDGRGTIRVRTRPEGAWVCLEFEDTGCGIPEQIRDRVFDPFFTTKEVGRGSGQGLAIARSIIVDKHKGKLEFRSQVGVGTTFSIRLPVAGIQDSAAAGARGATA